MRVVTWNMDSWKPAKQHAEAWDFLLNELHPDIALLQEARIPDNTDFEVLWTSALGRGPSLQNLTWGSAILSRFGKPVTRLAISPEDIATRGAVQIARCTIAGLGDVSIANIHSRLDGNRQALQKVIPNLTKTFEVVLSALGERFIVGGDLNTARSLDAAYGPRYGHGKFWNEVDAGILKEALPGGQEEQQSYWGHGDHNKGPTGNTLQDDHLFFDAETFKLVSECRVWDTPHIRQLSDHGPIVVDLDLPSTG